MKEKIKLRSATIEDANLLLEWRNDLQTRIASHNTKIIKRHEHQSWLKKSLNNPNRILFIAEKDGVPVGVVRIDYSDDVYELSWTVAPKARRIGIGKKMVALIANQIAAPIRAEIKVGNKASIRIAEYIGMKCNRKHNGVLYYQRPLQK